MKIWVLINKVTKVPQASAVTGTIQNQKFKYNYTFFDNKTQSKPHYLSYISLFFFTFFHLFFLPFTFLPFMEATVQKGMLFNTPNNRNTNSLVEISSAI